MGYSDMKLYVSILAAVEKQNRVEESTQNDLGLIYPFHSMMLDILLLQKCIVVLQDLERIPTPSQVCCFQSDKIDI